MHPRARRSLIVVTTLGLAAGSAAADAPPPEQLGEVGVSVEETTTDFGRLHLSAALLGYQLSSPDGGPVSTFGAFFELQERLVVHGHATLPLLGVVGGDTPPYRLEGGVMFFVKNARELEDEEVVLAQDSQSKTYAKMPMINHNRGGVSAQLMYAHGSEKLPEADGTGTMTTSSNALLAAVGIGAIGSTGFTVDVDGWGKRANFRWNAGGLDLLVDVARSYDTEPAEKGSRFGGRLWAETLWFRHLGMSARAEIGKYPGHAGWVLVASLGGSLHL